MIAPLTDSESALSLPAVSTSMHRSVDDATRVAIDPLRLTFSDATVERKYSEDYAKRMLRHGRRALLLGCTMFAIFGPLDASVIPHAKAEAWLIRYAVVCPLILMALLLSYAPAFARRVQAAVAVSGTIAYVGVTAMIFYADSPGGHAYYAGLSIVTIYIYIFSRLRFIYATPLSWALLCLYVACALAMQLEWPAFISNLFFLAGTNVFCMSASYTIERASRTGYLQRRTIRAQGMHLAAALSRAETLARQDSLTGLPNRRSFLEGAEAAFARAAESRSPMSVMVLDIDHFKSINDRFGHDGGDRVLQAVGAALPTALRCDDLLCRWGGEEFAVLLPATKIADAMLIAERLRLATQSLAVTTASGPVRATMSIGVAEQRHGESLEDVFKQADDALYRSKQMGRNRVSVAGRDSETLDSRVA